MQDSVFPATSGHSGLGTNKKGSLIKTIILVLVMIILISLVAVVSFFIGKNSGSAGNDNLDQQNSANTFVSQTPTPQLGAEVSNPFPTEGFVSNANQVVSPTVNIKSKILSSTATLDGFRSSDGSGNSNLEIRVGRNSTLVTRGFVSFGLEAIPSDSQITQATLRIYQAKVTGNPYTVGGNLKIDYLAYGDSLDSSDYGLAALSSGFATLSNNAKVEWKEVDVTARVKDDFANSRPNTQFRIHFQAETTGGDNIGDFASFESADDYQRTGNTPQLVVKYY